MKNFKPLHLFLFIGLLGITSNSCKVGRFVVYNFADINDHKKFAARNIENGLTTFYFPYATEGRVPKEVSVKDKRFPFEEYLKENKTVAFLIIQNDTIQYENYWGKHDERSVVPSFSMAKSITTMGSAWYYQYQWWLPTKSGDYMAQGILGQCIYVHPTKNLVIVRLGKSTGKANWREILASLGQAY